jgi:hypothetical protein
MAMKEYPIPFDEFVFRLIGVNLRKEGSCFTILLENAVKTPPTTFDDLLEYPKP